MAADPRQPYKSGMSILLLPIDDTSSLLKFCLLIWGRQNLPPQRLFWDLSVMAHSLTSLRSLLRRNLFRKIFLTIVLKPQVQTPACTLPSFPALCYFCFCWGLFQISSAHIFLSSLELPVFSGLPGHLAYPFIHRKLSLFWATQMLEKANKMTSKIIQAR